MHKLVSRLPIGFRKSPPAIAQYSWEDLTQALGYRQFYLVGSDDFANTSPHFLTETPVDADSYNRSRQGSTDSSTYILEFDYDFDITFGNPATIAAADLLFQGTLRAENSAGTGTARAYLHVYVYHYDGSTETELGNLASQEVTAGALTEKWIRILMKIPVTEKQFSKGDTLRITVKMYDKQTTGGSTGYGEFYFDPNSTQTFTDLYDVTIGSDAFVNVPFKIDI